MRVKKSIIHNFEEHYMSLNKNTGKTSKMNVVIVYREGIEFILIFWRIHLGCNVRPSPNLLWCDSPWFQISMLEDPGLPINRPILMGKRFIASIIDVKAKPALHRKRNVCDKFTNCCLFLINYKSVHKKQQSNAYIKNWGIGILHHWFLLDYVKDW